ncbi:MAG: ABC transporter ATP-binding protein, partial [Sarcina sp.]
EINNLEKKFANFTAVENISLKVKEGDIYGLLGPNGAGKSTTISMICGLAKLTSGNIKIFDVDVSKNMKNQNKILGYVPQDISVYENLTAYENLKFFGELYGLKGLELKNSIEKALDFVGLSDVRNKIPSKFSGGMKRRLNIACAIIHSPKIVIMDEPTVGIDPQSRNHILESVRKLNKEGVTIIYTTHYMEEVEAICNEIAVIDHGKVIVDGTKEELKNIVSAYKILEVDVADASAINIELLENITGVQEAHINDNHLEVHSEKEINNLNQIIECISKNTNILNIGFKDVNLETVFLSLTGRSLRD